MEEELERGTESVRSKTFRMYYILYIARFHLGEGRGGICPLLNPMCPHFGICASHAHTTWRPPLKF